MANGSEITVTTANNVDELADQDSNTAGTANIYSASTSAGLTEDFDNAESIVVQLIVGSIELKGTDLAISKDQATTLLPLWKEYENLVESMKPQGTPAAGQGEATPAPQTVDTATQKKIDTLITQIQAAMTTEQINAIADMKITRETALSVMKENGVTLGGSQTDGGNGQAPQGTPPAGGNGGEGNGGGGNPPPGGKPGGDGQMSGQKPGGGMVPPEFVSVLIQMLEETSGS